MNLQESHLTPPQAKRHNISISRLVNYWYIVCKSEELRAKPLARKLLGIPLVLFRNASGEASALLDRCPHRNVPLSQGRVIDGCLECTYHGWQFDSSGTCQAVPGLCSVLENKNVKRVSTYPVVEQDGFVWIFANPNEKPETAPYQFPLINQDSYTTWRGDVCFESTLHAALENFVDEQHTPFVHSGLLRSKPTRKEITAVIRRQRHSVEAEYLNEPRPKGIFAKILAPGIDEVKHLERFILPSIAQVEYCFGKNYKLLVTQAMTPVSDFSIRSFVIVTFRLGFPGWLMLPIIKLMLRRILHQDAEILKAQSNNIRYFGGEEFFSTEIDLLGSHIWLMLQQAERGELQVPKELTEKHIRILI
jgi:phenylpropionate dioxygenase-like ring-hydroxylating dioxygenase large terminal subunit